MITMGLDIGSTSSKAVVLEDRERLLSSRMIPLGTGTAGPMRVYEQALEDAGLTREGLDYLLATGYGRLTFPLADGQISEVSCHGRGVAFLLPGVRTIIDIGGQDAKALRVDGAGHLTNFVMNDKCAAGTGRFLDVMARVLDTTVDRLQELSSQATAPVTISNICTVFAESEVISHLSAGAAVPDVVAGIHRSVARRVAALALRIGVVGPVAMSGGVALNQGVVQAMAEELHCPVRVHPEAQLAGAYGAARIAYEKGRISQGRPEEGKRP